jgi:DNA-binding GntR family transcriptional regulator
VRWLIIQINAAYRYSHRRRHPDFIASTFQICRSQDFAEQHRQIRAAIDRNDPAAAMAVP